MKTPTILDTKLQLMKAERVNPMLVQYDNIQEVIIYV